MKKEDIDFLKEAYEFLENPSFITKVTDYLGKPIQIALDKLPKKAKDTVAKVSEIALRKSLQMAHSTTWELEKHTELDSIKKQSNLNRWGHNTATAITGAVGGFFGEAGITIELPITTTIIMRSILTQGQSFGEYSKEELIANAIYVFSLGSNKSTDDDEMDSAYYTSRVAMDSLIKQAAEYLAINGPKTVMKNIEAGTAPIILELISSVAQRFNIVVTEKMLAEALPFVGAVSGAGLNLLFTDFFTNSAKYHFGIKHLEKVYGQEKVRIEYEKIKKKNKTATIKN